MPAALELDAQEQSVMQNAVSLLQDLALHNKAMDDKEPVADAGYSSSSDSSSEDEEEESKEKEEEPKEKEDGEKKEEAKEKVKKHNKGKKVPDEVIRARQNIKVFKAARKLLHNYKEVHNRDKKLFDAFKLSEEASTKKDSQLLDLLCKRKQNSYSRLVFMEGIYDKQQKLAQQAKDVLIKYKEQNKHKYQVNLGKRLAAAPEDKKRLEREIADFGRQLQAVNWHLRVGCMGARWLA